MPGNWGFCGPTYQVEARQWACERSINLYPEFAQAGNPKSKVRLVGVPGMNTLATIGAPVRAIWAGDNVIYAVGGNTLYRVSLGGAVSVRGTLNSATTPAEICSNGDSLFIVSGDEAFIDNGVSVSQILDTEGDPLQAVGGTYQDGYYIALIKDSNKIQISGLLDGGTWDPLDFQVKMGTHDRLVRPISDTQNLWLFGQQTTQAWANTGNPDYPFERIPGSQIEMGALPWTISKFAGGLAFVGSNAAGANCVYRTVGFQCKRISNHAVEEALAWMPPTAYPRAYAYQERGHEFYVVCPPSGTSWVYDASADLWHERGVWNGSQWTPWPGDCAAHVYAHGVLIGDASGKIYLQSHDIGAIDGAPIRRERICPHVSNDGLRSFHHALTLDAEMGMVSSGAAPAVNMRYSNDGGRTYSANVARDLGTHDEFKNRAIWRRLGSARSRVYSVWTETTAVPFSITDAYLDVSAGTA